MKKKWLKRISFGSISLIILIYLTICTLFYFKQESLLFYPNKLESNHSFDFDTNFEEVQLEAPDGITLHSLLFKTTKSNGVIFYLHGNGESLEFWGQYAKQFNDLNYDVFFLDYRGYGKSEGHITDEKQFYQDAQLGYGYLKKYYPEEKITILGVSLGTSAASWIASQNQPSKLILLAPFFSIPDLKNNFESLRWARLIPSFLVKYKFRNYENIERVRAPVIIMHGDQDNVIYYGSSLKLKEHFKSGDTLITIKGGPHHIHHKNEKVQFELKRILQSD